jgi:large subunit ribosomal protein L25
MAVKTLNAQLREKNGTGEARRLRTAGLIPAVVYGHEEPKSISINAHEFERAFKHISENEIIELSVGKKKINVLIRDYQADILKNKMLHLDFYEIESGKTLRTHVPLKVIGSAKGMREGGILENPVHEVEIECLPKDLPEIIEVDISSLEIGHAIHVADISAGENVKILNTPEQVIASVGHAKAAVVEEEEETAAVEAPIAEEE